MYTKISTVRTKFPLAAAELQDLPGGQTDEWVIVDDAEPARTVLGRGDSMPAAWADAAKNLQTLNN